MAIKNWHTVMAVVDSVGIEAALSLPYVSPDANTMPDRTRRCAAEYNIQRGIYGEAMQGIPEKSIKRD